jgi:hypothetical protein
MRSVRRGKARRTNRTLDFPVCQKIHNIPFLSRVVEQLQIIPLIVPRGQDRPPLPPATNASPYHTPTTVELPCRSLLTAATPKPPAKPFGKAYKTGFFTLIPSSSAVYLAMKNSPRFAARTNMQSRTALAIMPALFMFAWTAVRSDRTVVAWFPTTVPYRICPPFGWRALPRGGCFGSTSHASLIPRSLCYPTPPFSTLPYRNHPTGRKTPTQDEGDRRRIEARPRHGPLGRKPSYHAQ